MKKQFCDELVCLSYIIRLVFFELSYARGDHVTSLRYGKTSALNKDPRMYMVVKLAIILLKLRICISINLVGEQYFNAMTKN